LNPAPQIQLALLWAVEVRTERQLSPAELRQETRL
jgi:hypothetical protein